MKRKRIFLNKKPGLKVCLYSQRECDLLSEKQCPIATELRRINDPSEWKIYSYRSAKCKHIGEELTRAQCNKRKLGLSV